MDFSQPNSPARFLRAQLLTRVSKNPSYSVRAFARDLGISHSYLSQILNEKRGLSLRQAVLLSDALNLEKEQKDQLIQLLLENRLSKSATDANPTSLDLKREESTVSIDMERFRTVREWYHGAIVEMTSLSQFKADYAWIARRLGVTTLQVKAAVNRLRRIGVLQTKGRKWSKTKRRFLFPTTSLQEAVNRFHQEMIYKALTALEQKTPSDFEERDITGITIAIDPKRIPEAKKRIQRFRNQLADFLSKGERSEVYHLNVQLFRLTQASPARRKRRTKKCKPLN